MRVLKLLEEKYPKWRILYRMVRVNNKPFDLNDTTPNGYVQNGSIFIRMKDFVLWEEFTALSNQVVTSSSAQFSHKGNFLQGVVNSFQNTNLEMDKDYLNENINYYAKEINENYFDSVNESSVIRKKVADFLERKRSSQAG